MDPVTGANTLATIVQLIGIFAQERKDKKNAERQEFLEWLEYHRHEDIKNLICNTAALQTEVLSLLQKDNATILTKLDSINATIGGLLSHGHAEFFGRGVFGVWTGFGFTQQHCLITILCVVQGKFCLLVYLEISSEN